MRNKDIKKEKTRADNATLFAGTPKLLSAIISMSEESLLKAILHATRYEAGTVSPRKDNITQKIMEESLINENPPDRSSKRSTSLPAKRRKERTIKVTKNGTASS